MNIEEKYINCNHIWINDKCIKCELDRKMYEYGSKYGEDLLFQNESIMYNTIKNNVNIMKKGINIIVKKEDEEITKRVQEREEKNKAIIAFRSVEKGRIKK